MRSSQVLIYIVAILFVSCSGTKNISQKKAKEEKWVQQVLGNRLEYDFFSAKAKVRFESPDQNIGFNVQMKIKKDSLIWMKVQKLSIEGMRVQISKEKIQVLNRQENQYLLEDFKSIQSKLPLSVNYQDIEDLIIGNPLDKNLDFVTTKSENKILMEAALPLSQGKGNIKIWLNEQKQIEKMSAVVDSNSLEALYGDYRLVNESQMIPFEKSIQIDGPQGLMRFQISFTKVDLNQPEEMIFEIPEHYQTVKSGVNSNQKN